MKRIKILRWLLLGAATLVFLIGTLATVSLLWIGHDIRQACREACQARGMAYPARRADALIATVNDPGVPLNEKNRAVWAMGYVKDDRLLPVLRGLVANGGQCNHQRFVCQSEVKKAIQKQTGERPSERAVLALLASDFK